MSIARPTTVGSRKAAADGPIAGHLLAALIARILRASEAQAVPIVIKVHGVPAGAAVVAPGADDGEFARLLAL